MDDVVFAMLAVTCVVGCLRASKRNDVVTPILVVLTAIAAIFALLREP